jgi:serine/threonine-protein kinase
MGFIPLIGETFCHYHIVERIGAGGMGEVYRATDTKLGRDVAMKVLPETFAKNGERMARFRREAQVLASLNHPNIATIYGLEESNGNCALAMELVEGPTLAERIAGATVGSGLGPPTANGTHTGIPIPLDEALPVAKQVAEGLEYAHDRGIVHRDLKPANVKVRLDGTVKILDFGLAKALEETPAAGSVNTSPTITAAATREGIILGTAAYMSPEQAKGRPADRRADVWAFGCVLYEMLTGRQAFRGETVPDVLASVIKSDPDWTALPATTPVTVVRLIQRCVNKDPRRRVQAIGDARIAIEDVVAGTGEEPRGAVGASPGVTVAGASPLQPAA